MGSHTALNAESGTAHETAEDTEYNVITAKDGEEAVNLAVSQKPDIIILNYGMPKKTGFDAFLEIRKHSDIGKTPIIITSGLAERFEEFKDFETGAEDYLELPFDFNELIKKIKELLQKKTS